MKKKTAMVIFLCFVCVAVIGICAMAGISKWQEYQTAQQRQQQLDAYVDGLGSAFDDLYQVETGLLDDMAQQSTAGVSSREILLAAIEAVGKPIDQLASVQAPEELADAQRHFATAAESYHTMSDQLTTLLQDETQNPEQLRDTLIDLLPDAIDAVDQVRYGIQVLAERDDITLPDSAVQLEQSLDSLMNGGMDSLITQK
ncbi:hypothetical protein [Butyricicoccus sp.]|uniref:hypothetical protein n=1 Tax=Butyricicoccus sp. TaxID=2049021 RepID=UPI003F17E9BD